MRSKLLSPFAEVHLVRQNLSLNFEIQDSIAAGSDFSFEEIVDIKRLFDDAAMPVFAYEELLNIFHNVQTANHISEVSKQLKDYQQLYRLLSRLHHLPEITAKFNRIFDFEGNVLDTASAELNRIRKQMTALRARISRTMQSLVQDTKMEKFLQDKFVTQRNDRYVLPVKESCGSFVKGIVQSHSSTKATIFIEPESVVPLSNDLQMLKQEEKTEIYRILRDYTTEIKAFAKEIVSDTGILAELDFRYACGRLGIKLRSRVPQIVSEAYLELTGARHPLLIMRFGNVHEVIPYDFSLGKDNNFMVLSGPNTGGKTVLLKSVGLITLMALSGLPVPVESSSTIGMFTAVYADIGDDQSIENALSTFSSHIDKIRRMLEQCDERTLILIDEIGAATDPQQGSALAQVILERFVERRVKGIVTTHYTALKVFAEHADGCFNASMQFDLKSLQPTYRFIPGFPGDSFAIEVAASLGLDKAMIAKAKELCGTQSIEFTQLLKTMQTEKKKLGRELYEYELKNRNLQARIDELDAKDKDFEKELKQRRQTYLKELQKELIGYQKAYNSELGTIRQLDKDERKQRSETKLTEIQQMQNELQTELGHASLSDRKKAFSIQVGSPVWLANFETDAIVLEIKGKEVLVDMNGISFKTDLSNLYESRIKAEKAVTVRTASVSSPSQARLELKLLGMTFDEAQPLIDEFIDEALVAGLHKLRIVHGKGTGALRTKVRDYLRKKKAVIGTDTPAPEAGGSGVTVVTV
jgi:DNA mismatch repair protein MutS2